MTKSSTKEKRQKHLKWKCSCCSPNFKLETPRPHSGVACDRPEIIEIPKLPPIPEVVWQQPSETSTNQLNLDNFNNDSTSRMTLASPLSPPKGTQPENYVVGTEHPPGNPTGNDPVPFLNCSMNCPTDIRKSEQHITTKFNADTTIPPLTTTTPLSEEVLVRDEQTNEVYLPLTSTVVLKSKQEMLYVPLDFENNLTVDALVDSAAFISAFAQSYLDTIKQKAPNDILRMDDPPIFKYN